MTRFNVKKKEILQWIKNNTSKYKEFTEKEEGKDYEIMKLVIKAIVKERKNDEEDMFSLTDIKNLNGIQAEFEKESEENSTQDAGATNNIPTTPPNNKIKASHQNIEESSTQEDREGGRGA